MRKPTLHPVFGKLGTTEPVGVVASVRLVAASKRLDSIDRAQADKSVRNWIALKFAICVWAVGIAFVLFGWWPT